MDFLKKHKTKIVVVLILLLGFILYGFFFAGDSADDTLLTSDGPSESASDSDLIELLAQLRSLTLDETFFNNTTFRELSDFSVEILPQSVGRQNPFAPFGVGLSFSNPEPDVNEEEEPVIEE